MPNFDLANLALKAVCPNNEILYDDKGLPSIMVKIPKQTYAQLGLGDSTATHPAWIVNGQEVDAIYISKYQNIVQDGRAYSLPGQAPKHSINFDAARQACEAKGSGWHLMTRAEWSALALWCKQHGTMPKGNNNYGKDDSESLYTGIPVTFENDGRTRHIATGTGPLSYSHDGTPSGIWDLNGNVSEWNGGIRTVYGELQVLVNNNAADPSHSQSATSTEWKAISGSTGEFIAPNGTGTTPGSIKMDWITNHCQYTSGALTVKEDANRSCLFENISCDATIGEAAKLVLQALGMLKYDDTAGAYNGDTLYFNNGQEERAFCCGGNYGYGAAAGVFFSYGSYARSHADAGIGFRSAYVSLPTA